MTAPRCPNCDRPTATLADSLDRSLNPDEGDGTDALCWRRWNIGDRCAHPPVDWRGRYMEIAEYVRAHARLLLAQADLETARLNTDRRWLARAQREEGDARSGLMAAARRLLTPEIGDGTKG